MEERVNDTNLEEENLQETSSKENKKDKKLKDKIKELEDQANNWKNKFYQAYADMDNLRKLMEKDHQQMVKYRGQGFLESLLPVLDNFYMAFKVTPSDPTLAAYCKGFEMIYNQMVSALELEGVKEITPQLGVKFDHNTMQAVDVVEGEEDDVVVQVANKGYLYRDRLVRPAMVVVSKKPQEEEKVAEEAVEENSTKVN
jgi:molecular chaperone GrpE